MTRASRWNSGIQFSSTVPRCTPSTTTVPRGRDELDRPGEALVRAGRLDDDVVDAVGARPARRAARRPPAGAGGAPRARRRRRPSGGRRRPRAGRARPRRRPPPACPGPSRRGAARATRPTPARRSTRRGRRGPAAASTRRAGGARNCSAMPPSAVTPSARWAWVGHRLYAPRQALLALHAAVERLDHDGGAVLADAGELVAEDPCGSRQPMYSRSDAQTLVDRMSSSSPAPGGSSTSTTTTPPSAPRTAFMTSSYAASPHSEEGTLGQPKARCAPRPLRWSVSPASSA